ncbi:hypothetical protein FS842_004372 [Serendipita sp. 407]|nr:hypothetical protein FS842_004372 [Serendipita sp. 407]
MAENTKGMKFYKVDTDAQQDVMHEAGIRAMPTFAVYQKGEKKGQVLGARPQMMMELIQKYRDLDTK